MHVRFGCAEIGACLAKLLIDFRSVDFREQLPRLYARADVHVPAFQVAVRARIDRSIFEGLHVSRENDFLARGGLFGLCDHDAGHGKLIRLVAQRRSCPHPGDNA